jgi:hypothetical protein
MKEKDILISEGPFRVGPLLFRRGAITHRVSNKSDHTIDVNTQAECIALADRLNMRYAAWCMARGTAAEGHV